MRTSGTFQEVYQSAKSYALGTAEDSRPINPVIRREGEKWMLESGLEPTDGDFEISLDGFDNYFWESYKSQTYSPTNTDMATFVASMILGY